MSAAVTGGSGVRPDKELTVFMTLKHTHNHGGGILCTATASPTLCFACALRHVSLRCQQT